MFTTKNNEFELETEMYANISKQAKSNDIKKIAINEVKLAAKLLDDIGLKQASNRLLEVANSMK